MNSTESVEVSPVDNYIAGGVILIIASVGVILNGTTTALMVRVKNLRNSFGFLCVSQGVADCGILVIFAFWCAPVTLRYELQMYNY